jgi:hypothetical protein
VTIGAQLWPPYLHGRSLALMQPLAVLCLYRALPQSYATRLRALRAAAIGHVRRLSFFPSLDLSTVDLLFKN